MKTNLSLIVVLFFLITAAKAQKISGKIMDAAGKPQEFVSVMLMHLPDSTMKKGAVTENDGSFVIEHIDTGTYYINASMVGFKNSSTKKFAFDGKTDLVIESIALKNLDEELKTVTITTRKPTFEVKPDRIVFNVDASPSATGLNGLELLRRSPSVTIDKDENVILKGKNNVAIWINGKPSPLTGTNLAAFLKSLLSDDIEAIEIISNPGAKFDAAGTGGIINIKLKKNRKIGTNGNVSIGLQEGITPKGDASINLNYRDNKINVFSSYSNNRGIYHNSLYVKTITGDTTYTQNGDQQNEEISNNGKIGADYFIDSKNTVGFIVNGGYNTQNHIQPSSTIIQRISTGKTDSILNANSFSTGYSSNINYNLNYRFADTSGHELGIDADYGNFKNHDNSYLTNNYVDPTGLKTLTTNNYRSITPVNVDIKTIKADYEQKLGKGKLGFGAKYSDVITDNTIDYYNVNVDKEVINIDRSNNFVYKEQVTAGYVNWNETFGKFGVQLGLRAENTHSMGILTAMKPINDKNVDSTYLNFFPSVAVSFTKNENNAFNFTYRHSIDRPDYKSLNPFEYQLNELLFEKGNPFLRPQYSHSFDLSYTYHQAATLSVGYARTNDYITETTDQEFDAQLNKYRFFVTKRNLATFDHYFASLQTPIPIKKWWNVYLNSWFNYDFIKADFGGGKIVDIQRPEAGFYMQHTFSLGNGWTTEANGNWSTGGNWGTFVSKPQGFMGVAVMKKFWDGDGTLKLAFDDVFHTSNWTAVSSIGNLTIQGHGTWEGQRVKLNFGYRFGSKLIKGARNHQTGIEAEKKRVKS